MTGRGDGPIAAYYTPKPANFTRQQTSGRRNRWLALLEDHQRAWLHARMGPCAITRRNAGNSWTSFARSQSTSHPRALWSDFQPVWGFTRSR